jgi:hypothetical protein
VAFGRVEQPAGLLEAQHPGHQLVGRQQRHIHPGRLAALFHQRNRAERVIEHVA